MSFGRHACRHALRPPACPSADHLWVSDDLLAATFRRFANGQRRHGSCVPGPLEARRRLAKRRNTVLASVGGGPPEDIACLFGRNGREHMKWSEQPWQRVHLESQDYSSYAVGTAEIPLPFYDGDSGPIEPSLLDLPPAPSSSTKHQSREQLLDDFLRGNYWTIEDARDKTRHLRIDLQREPKHSRQIFNRLLARSTEGLSDAVAFLDDPFLNTRGSGNYVAAVEFVQAKTKRLNRTAVLNSINRALELGLVPTDEICRIVNALPKFLVQRQKTLGAWDQKALLKHYNAMWKAIGRCNILGYRDLDKQIVDAWLTELLSIKCFRFAGDIIVATHDASSDYHWPSTLITTWLDAAGTHKINLHPSHLGAFLDRLHADYASRCIHDVTTLLALPDRESGKRNQLLEQWRECLLSVSNASAIASSDLWLDSPAAYLESTKSEVAFSARQDIILRLWSLRTLSRSQGPMYNQGPKATDRPIYLLFSLYETATQQSDGFFLADLLSGIQSLDLPYNHLLLLAVDVKLRKITTKTTRRTLEQLETSQITLSDAWADQSMYKGIRIFFHGTFEKMFRRLDLTSPSTVQDCLHLARVGDSRSVWSILRLLRNHMPFKICLHKAWVPIPHPDEKVLILYNPRPRDSETPDPHAAVDFIHQLAVTFSCCQHLTPSRSFHLIHWLYNYLRRHGGPVYPSLVRAMYHAGVVRYRREGRRVSPTQYEYILWIVRKFDGPDVVRELTAMPRIGQSSHNKHDS
ncbi:hypothetical protein N7492_005772 [Penicillium capsulatum]|uniref:Uncharacterized protein n=1 Tax=Penicillium capsulatum TaxID=69766 RepID=A0A9W9IC35_9EURO|nr:hypothetical protein N7492_005772 [Penicillium capsulatum]